MPSDGIEIKAIFFNILTRLLLIKTNFTTGCGFSSEGQAGARSRAPNSSLNRMNDDKIFFSFYSNIDLHAAFLPFFRPRCLVRMQRRASFKSPSAGDTGESNRIPRGSHLKSLVSSLGYCVPGDGTEV